ncbi:MAG: hypothetical protein IT383_27995 [Deltaproteobacteria bacterium]|nr:hypothetical protein [Deltaproteobacteria bacterium]
MQAKSWASFALVASLSVATGADAATVTGVITDEQGNPLSDVTVRWQGRGAEAVAKTRGDGGFALAMDGEPDDQDMYFIGVGKKGYFNIAGGVEAGGNYTIPLKAVDGFDNKDYVWVPPQAHSDDSPFAEGIGCGFCHADYHDAWADSKHAQAAKDPYVLDLYTGTGGRGTVTSQGPGWLVDNPTEAGPCANCHAPTAALAAPNATRLDQVSGAHLNGVFCESCHKVRDVGNVEATPVTGAFQYWRPQNGVLMAFGPLDDAGDEHHMGPMSYQPDMKQSRFCAGCHQWTSDNGVKVMDTYGEWAISRYAELGIQCQDCHMRPLDHDEPAMPLPPLPEGFEPGDPYCILRSPVGERGQMDMGDMGDMEMEGVCEPMGAVLRDQSTLNPHTFKGTSDEYHAAAASLEATATRVGQFIEVQVAVENVNAGHMLPTGMPFRSLLLTVQATDADGAPLSLAEGPALPAWVDAPGEAAPRAGQAGRAYARLLSDASGALDVPFWRATQVVLDDRIPPFGKDVSIYRFLAPPVKPEASSVRVELRYLPFLPSLAAAKGWQVEERLMAGKTVQPARSDGCAAAPSGAPLALFALLGALPLCARRRLRRSLLAVAGLTALTLGCDGGAGPTPPGSVQDDPRAPLDVGERCTSDESCETGRCAESCDAVWRCVAASCTSDADCALGGIAGCCVDGACMIAPGGACGDASSGAGDGCSVGGDSDCAAGLRCANSCTPTAVCAAPCERGDQCSDDVHSVTGRRIEYCAETEAGAAYCLEDPEVAGYCAVDAQCDDGSVCAFAASRAGSEMLTLCSVTVPDAAPMGHSCLDAQNQPSDAACAVGWCWYGGDLPETCSAVCRFDANDLAGGDADCACAAADAACQNQVCVPYPFALEASGVVPLCLPSNRCLKDADCGAGSHCATEDLTVDLETLCMPVERPGDPADTDCANGPMYCCRDNRCEPRKVHGETCTRDSECLDRCVDQRCTGPCDVDLDCAAPFTGCRETEVPYGSGTATRSVRMCRL